MSSKFAQGHDHQTLLLSDLLSSIFQPSTSVFVGCVLIPKNILGTLFFLVAPVLEGTTRCESLKLKVVCGLETPSWQRSFLRHIWLHTIQPFQPLSFVSRGWFLTRNLPVGGGPRLFSQPKSKQRLSFNVAEFLLFTWNIGKLANLKTGVSAGTVILETHGHSFVHSLKSIVFQIGIFAYLCLSLLIPLMRGPICIKTKALSNLKDDTEWRIRITVSLLLILRTSKHGCFFVGIFVKQML